MRMIAGMTEMLFGTGMCSPAFTEMLEVLLSEAAACAVDEPVFGAEAGQGPARHGWVELNDQRSTPERRETQVQKLAVWLALRTAHDDCELCIAEELVEYCTTELLAFCDPRTEGAAGVMCVVEAGAAEACVAVLEDDELASSAYVQALELLGVISSGTSTQLWHSSHRRLSIGSDLPVLAGQTTPLAPRLRRHRSCARYPRSTSPRAKRCKRWRPPFSRTFWRA